MHLHCEQITTGKKRQFIVCKFKFAIANASGMYFLKLYTITV